MNVECPEETEALIAQLYHRGMIRTWYKDKPDGWVLVSGLWSPLYIQLRPLCSFPDLLRSVGYGIGRLVHNQIPGATRLIGIAMAGIPIAVATSLAISMPCAMTRKLPGVRTLGDMRDAKLEYGEHSDIEGAIETGDEIVLLDDLVTKFDSKLVALEQLRREVRRRHLANVNCTNVVVLFDREQGAKEAALREGINLYCLIPFLSEGLPKLKTYMAEREYEIIAQYLQNPTRFQDPNLQHVLRNECPGRTVSINAAP
jgi:orotate phosphoribosyltransferase